MDAHGEAQDARNMTMKRLPVSNRHFRERMMDRRTFLGAAAAGAALAGGLVSSTVSATTGTVKVGFLAPLTGEMAARGLPGLHGCELWAEKVRAAGGVRIGDGTYDIELVPFDDEHDATKAITGATKLIFEDGVKFVMMPGGDTWPGVQPIVTRSGMLASTLMPSDLSPDTPTLIAPCEAYPVYNVTGVSWMADRIPESSTAVICGRHDSLGRPSVATYLAACEAHGIDVLDIVFFDASTTDFAPVVASMLAKRPDILCLDTAYAGFVHPLCEQAHRQGFRGRIISCAADGYEKIVERTSREFMEGFVFQFPDFDDPALNRWGINFDAPGEFHAEYDKRWPGQWSAVSWEYASIMDLWVQGAQRAGSIEPRDVLAGMKQGGEGKHAFGTAKWWGKELFGIDNALVGDWPVVVIENGKAVIKEFRSIPEWWDTHGDLLVKHFTEMGEMYYQRG